MPATYVGLPQLNEGETAPDVFGLRLLASHQINKAI